MTTAVVVPATVRGEAPAPAQPLKRGDACTVVIFGASGDLAKRKLFPALFHLQCDGMLHEDFALVGVARAPMSDDAFRRAVYESARHADDPSPAGEIDEEDWSRFAPRLSYVQGDIGDAATYTALGERLGAIESARPRSDGRLFYLSVPPSVYADCIAHLSRSGVAERVNQRGTRPWARVVIEKPFGHDLESAKALNRAVRKAFSEHQVYRIDHYLGKETVQNLMVFRFANSIFEPVWNRHHVHHVQITAAETVGVEHRAGYYEEAGVVRDMFQNHLLQLLALTAMEPPVAFQADAVRDEKLKVLRAIRRFSAARDARLHGAGAVRAGDGQRHRGAGLPRGARCGSGIGRADLGCYPAAGGQLAVAWGAVLPALGQADGAAGVGDRHPVPGAASPHVPAGAGPDHRAQRHRDPGAAPGGYFARVRHQGARRRRQDDRGPDGLQLRRGLRPGRPLGLRDACCSTAWWATPRCSPGPTRSRPRGKWWIR